MVSRAQDFDRLRLIVLRLMDADVLPPNEGKALLAEVEALARTPEGEADSYEFHSPPREAAEQTDRLHPSQRGVTPESADKLTHDTAEPR